MTEQKKQTTKKNITKGAPTEVAHVEDVFEGMTEQEIESMKHLAGYSTNNDAQEAKSPSVDFQDGLSAAQLEDIFTKARIVNSIIEMESANANMVDYFNKLVAELTTLQKEIEEKEAALKDDPNAPLHEKKINEQKVAYGALYKRLKLTEQRVQAVSMILEELDEKLLRG
jgi:hypothetical protein